jgi:hypothetical protein
MSNVEEESLAVIADRIERDLKTLAARFLALDHARHAAAALKSLAVIEGDGIGFGALSCARSLARHHSGVDGAQEPAGFLAK